MKRGYLYWSAGFVALASFVVYSASLSNGFISTWDDGPYILDNPHIHSIDLPFFRWAFFEFHSSNWHPLTWISHALDYAAWGLNPFGHHLHNVMLHAINSLLVVILIARLLDAYVKTAPGGERSLFFNEHTTLLAAVLTGLLFGLHPLHVESVAWISERKDVLSALFFLASLISYSYYTQPADRRQDPGRSALPRFFNTYYLLTFGFFILALLSKPMAITLPIILLFLDWCPFSRMAPGKPVRAVLVEKIPFFVLALADGFLTISAQRAGGALNSVEPVPLSGRMLVAAHSLIAYLEKMVAPFNLVPFYPYPRDNVLEQISITHVFSIALVAGITLFCVRMRKRQKVWPAIWGCYAVSLLPVLGIIQVGGQSMADRYTYLPSIGPFLVMALGATWVCDRVVRGASRGLIMKTAAVAVLVLLLAGLSYLTVRQTRVWNSSIDLWNYVIEKEPERAPFAYNLRALALKQEGSYALALSDLDRAIALDQTYEEAYVNRAVLLGQLGSIDKAIEDLNRAIALNPARTEAYINRGSAYAMLGRYDSALEDFDKALALNQSLAEAYNNRAKVYWKTGQRELAVADFRKACDLGYEPGCSALHEL